MSFTESFQHDKAHNVDEPFCEMSPTDLAEIAFCKGIAPRPPLYMTPCGGASKCIICHGTDRYTSTRCGVCDECLQRLHLEGKI